MTRPIILRVALSVVAIFLAGAVAGAFLGARFQLETQTKRAEIGNLSDNVMDMLDKRLSLSAEQSAKFTPMVDEACGELRSVYQASSTKVHDIMRNYYHRMSKDLSAKQAAILEDMESELRAKARNFDSNH